MKRFFAFLLACLLFISLCACDGTYGRVELKDVMELPQDGVVEEKILKEIKKGNEIATFTSESNGLKYEWKIFGSELTEVKDVNLSLSLKTTADCVEITFAEEQELGFFATLSIHLNEKWSAQTATAYSDDVAVCSVSLTGSKTTILNLSLDHVGGIYVISPDTSETNSTEDMSRPNSDGNATDQDKYLTDPVPEGKPLPVEPEDQEVDKGKAYTCTFSIECSTILNNLENLDPDKLELVPSNGVILVPTTVTFYEGESVFDVLQRVCKENNIHLEFSWTPIYNSAYIEGIHNLYEFDCGPLSGWMYRVDGWYPNYGCSRYQLADGEVVEWRYTCNDLGKDIGCDWMA